MKKILIISYTLIVIGIIVLGILAVAMNHIQQTLNQHQQLRYQSYLLADQLRQSSDDLTRMARTYVVTQEDKYEQMYWDILAIRNGEKPRPQAYDRIYWDLVLNDGDKPRPDGVAQALHDLMVAAGFTDQELNKLQEAQNNSDGLVNTETIAMNAIKGLYEDDNGQFTRQGDPNPELAIRLMHDSQYHAYKADIMQPIDEFFQLINTRTQYKVDYYQQQADKLLLAIQISVLFLAILTISIGIAVSRWVLYQVGGEPKQIAYIAHKVANGELDVEFIDNSHTTGIYAAIQTMVNNLQFIISETRCHLEQLAEGHMNLQFSNKYIGDFGEIRNALENTTQRLAAATEQNNQQNWLKSGQAQLNENMRGTQDLVKLSANIIQFFAQHLNAQVGTLFLLHDEAENAYLKLFATYAYINRKTAQSTYQIGEGVVGQAALEKKLFTIAQPPENYLLVHSSLGECPPKMILVAPFLYEGELKGVIELASLEAFSALQLEFLNQVLPAIAIAIHTAQARAQMQQLLTESRAQAEQLALKQNALQESNEELQAQSEELQTQQEELQSQQEELRQTNEELELRSRALEQQRSEIADKNAELQRVQAETERKAAELANASKYKSEFLANMSHELRTPLNSLLILAQLLAENKEKTLSPTQVEYANTIFNSGNDLLNLINDILDLSKVEAGKLEIYLENIVIAELVDALKNRFQPLAEQKGLVFNIQLAADVPEMLVTDEQRLGQVITNLLSNAFKFTQQGAVDLHLYRPTSSIDLTQSGLNPVNALAISVSDTGIGIAENKQGSIFAAFQQADGTTSRRFGGTGLGLSISQQFIQLLGGEIHLQSQENQGSIFTIYLPLHHTESLQTPTVQPKQTADNSVAETNTESTTHIPEYIILLVSDDKNHQQVICDALQDNDVALIIAENYAQAQELLATETINCAILEADIAQHSGMQWLQQQCEARFLQQCAVIVYLQRQLDEIETTQFAQLTNIAPQVQMVHSPEQLLDAVMVFLHQIAADTPHAQQQIMQKIQSRKDILANKKVLLVDDDVRNLFSISAILEDKNIQVIDATNGKEALAQVAQHSDIDLVLMDIMMPEMDGYEATRQIRQQHRYLPIIALTAKAMKGDKAKCIEAGANDYLAKPVDTDKLLSLMRVWLYQ